MNGGRSTVPRTPLGPDMTISRALTGMWQIADMERGRDPLDPDATADAMVPYVEAGLTTFDMADHYGSAEVIAGRFRKRHAMPVELLTKWVPRPEANTREDVRDAVRRSLDRMQADRIDLLQFHAWNYANPNWLDCLHWLEELREEGLIRYLGLTNFDTAHLAMVLHSGIEVVSNQVCFSLVDRRARNGMTALCARHGVALLAFGTLGGGLFTERWLGRPAPEVNGLETWSEMKYRRFVDAAGGWQPFERLLEVVHDAARRHGVSMANVATRYVLDEPGVGGVIVGARLGRHEHIDDTVRTFAFSLDDEHRAAIDAAVADLRPIPGDCGDEYRRPPFLTASGDLSHHLETMPAPYDVARGADGRSRVRTGTIWEELAGFSRAVRLGDRVWISGTTATHGDRPVGGDDPASQFHFAVDKIAGALESVGGALADVVRTRIYLKRAEDWEPVSRAHRVRFGDAAPANTLIQASIIGDEYLVEVEAEAVLRSASGRPGAAGGTGVGRRT